MLVTLAIPLATTASDLIEIRIPKTSDHITRDEYEIGLLKLLLGKVPGNYKITKSSTAYTQLHIIHELHRGSTLINLHWAGTSPDLESNLIPIYFPIYRGLMGYRVFVISKDKKNVFEKVNNLDDLSRLEGAQGMGWSDKQLLEVSGLKQYSANYEYIFSMIDKGRIDYFSRGIMEAYSEVAARKSALSNLIVDENILLFYPFATYFFVNRNNPELATLLSSAFVRAYEDGSFLNYFNNHPKIRNALELLNNDNRLIINIPNPFLTQQTKNLPARYWYQKLNND